MSEIILAMMLGSTPPVSRPAPPPSEATKAPISRMVDDEQLRTVRGKAIIITNQTLQALTSGNTLGNYAAGNVSLGDNALSNFAGVGNFLINTGAQNSLQSGMTLVINLNP